MNIIETRNLTKNYGQSRGIIDLNLCIEEGDFFGFIGPNGAGKSTTIRTLLGLISPTSGEATVFGMPLSQSVDYVKDIGYLASEAMFYENMRVKELIDYSAKLRGKDCSEEAAKLCEILCLDTKKRIDELSLGNRKKVGIVCAMQHKPKLYIMDEPTSGLDPLMQKVFFDLLEERNREGATVFFSSHVLSEVQSHCNNIALIREGRLALVDSIDKISKNGAKRVVLSGITDLPESLKSKTVDLQINKTSKNEGSVSFLYRGDVQLLMNEIAKMAITDISITEPELEEIFMHYYEKEAE